MNHSIKSNQVKSNQIKPNRQIEQAGRQAGKQAGRQTNRHRHKQTTAKQTKTKQTKTKQTNTQANKQKQAINKASKQPSDRSTNQPTNQPTNRPTDQPTNQASKRARSTKQPNNRPGVWTDQANQRQKRSETWDFWDSKNRASHRPRCRAEGAQLEPLLYLSSQGIRPVVRLLFRGQPYHFMGFLREGLGCLRLPSPPPFIPPSYIPPLRTS